MERNTNTTFSELKEGDRFYKANDKKKCVWEKQLIFVMSKNAHKEVAIKDSSRFSEAIKYDTEVIFLKSKIETI